MTGPRTETRWRRHRETTSARLAAETATRAAGDPVSPPTEGPLASAYELKRAQLGLDLKALREIESVERKIEAKRSMIASYTDHIAGWIDGATTALAEGRSVIQDDIAVTIMIWHIDTGNYDAALAIAEIVFAGGLSLPERYERNPDGRQLSVC